ncbi:hypothetical protein CO2235_90255 [Cupriavidus oxalaticus]|uniref:Uncharacterized protein n=1 Tax=Cupriavidus oxalaticus TaxID=96344 RepID=A0A976BFS0_9BURK|nr:hypothetical protein CO2235_90255 [Cupriavidus oxalaticus]
MVHPHMSSQRLLYGPCRLDGRSATQEMCISGWFQPAAIMRIADLAGAPEGFRYVRARRGPAFGSFSDFQT